MYKDIVIKKRVWVEEDYLHAWSVFDPDGEEVEMDIESTIADFNGRIPVENAIRVGDWITDGFKLIKSDCAEIMSEGDRVITPQRVEEVMNQWKIIDGDLLPVCFSYGGKGSYAIEFSNGERSALININWFQYVYEGAYDYSLMVNELDQTGLVLKRDGLVCGYLMGMMKLEPDVIWERPYSLADVEALKVN